MRHTYFLGLRQLIPRRAPLLGSVVGLIVPSLLSLLSAADAPTNDDLIKLKASLAELSQRVDELTAAAADAPTVDESSTHFTLKGFGDIGYVASSTKADGTDRSTSNEFAVGTLDLFMNAKLGDRVSFLAEVALEAGENATAVDVERMLVKYDFGDFLNVQVGRFHTSLGYWNENYHHGEWLNTSIGRPVALNFEDGGGVLPVHMVGLVLKGSQTLGAMGLDYTCEIGNGRGPTNDPPQITNDANTAKAVLLQLAVRPLAVPGLKLGVSVFLDTINPYTNAGGDDTNPTHEAMGEHIFNAYAVYRSGPWEAIGEIFQINHQLTSGPDDGKTVIDYSYYGQFGYRYHTWTPYVRYDRLQLSNDETYFSTTTDSRRTLSAGLRWDVATWNAIKVQYNNIHHDPVPAAAEPSSVEHQIAFQTAFAF